MRKTPGIPTVSMLSDTGSRAFMKVNATGQTVSVTRGATTKYKDLPETFRKRQMSFNERTTVYSRGRVINV
jgi:hypothetical protein